MGHNKVNVEANFSYMCTKYGTRRNPLYGFTKMELEETNLFWGPQKNGIRRNPNIWAHKK